MAPKIPTGPKNFSKDRCDELVPAMDNSIILIRLSDQSNGFCLVYGHLSNYGPPNSSELARVAVVLVLKVDVKWKQMFVPLRKSLAMK